MNVLELDKVAFTEADAHRAYDEWGANCGPGALAAIAGLTLDQVRPLMGDFETKHYTNPTLMYECMNRAGLKWKAAKDKTAWPRWGLVRVQWEGPWTKEGVPMRVRYRHTHWVGARTGACGIEVFDINAMTCDGWIPLAVWRDNLVPWIIEHCVPPKADGKWHLTHVLEVERDSCI
jgi:hypothetical protein